MLPEIPVLVPQARFDVQVDNFQMTDNPHRTADDDRGDAPGLMLESSMKHERICAP